MSRQSDIVALQKAINSAQTPPAIKASLQAQLDKLQASAAAPVVAPVSGKKKSAKKPKKARKPYDKTNNTFAIAKEIRKAEPQLSHQEAVHKAKTVKGKIKAANTLGKLRRLVEKSQSLRALYGRTSEARLQKDAARKAKKPGWRVSRTGHKYFEARANRADRHRKSSPYLAKGGVLTGRTHKAQDAKIRAKSPGQRVSAAGNEYWEERANRADAHRKSKPYLAKGGNVK